MMIINNDNDSLSRASRNEDPQKNSLTIAESKYASLRLKTVLWWWKTKLMNSQGNWILHTEISEVHYAKIQKRSPTRFLCFRVMTIYYGTSRCIELKDHLPVWSKLRSPTWASSSRSLILVWRLSGSICRAIQRWLAGLLSVVKRWKSTMWWTTPWATSTDYFRLQ